MEEYYLLSFEKQGRDPELCFWREAAKGYTTNLIEAGRYDRETVLEHYHKSANNVAIPAEHIHCITAKLKAFFEPRLGSTPRLVVHVIPHKEAKGFLLGNLAFGAVLMGRETNGAWHWRVLRKPPVQEQEPLETNRL